jgi:hypothetical protein
MKDVHHLNVGQPIVPRKLVEEAISVPQRTGHGGANPEILIAVLGESKDAVIQRAAHDRLKAPAVQSGDAPAIRARPNRPILRFDHAPDRVARQPVGCREHAHGCLFESIEPIAPRAHPEVAVTIVEQGHDLQVGRDQLEPGRGHAEQSVGFRDPDGSVNIFVNTNRGGSTGSVRRDSLESSTGFARSTQPRDVPRRAARVFERLDDFPILEPQMLWQHPVSRGGGAEDVQQPVEGRGQNVAVPRFRDAPDGGAGAYRLHAPVVIAKQSPIRGDPKDAVFRQPEENNLQTRFVKSMNWDF